MANVILVLLALGVMIRFTSLRAYFCALPWPHALVTLLFCYLTFLGHFLGQSRQTYPFTQWNMYCKREVAQPARWLEFTGRTSEGDWVRLDVNALQPALGHLRLRMRLNDLLMKAETAQEATMGQRWLEVLATWQSEHDGKPLTRLRVEEMTWASPEADPQRRLLKDVEVGTP